MIKTMGSVWSFPRRATVLLCFALLAGLLTASCMRRHIVSHSPGAKESPYTKTSPKKLAPYIRSVFEVSQENMRVAQAEQQIDDLKALEASAASALSEGQYFEALRLYEQVRRLSSQEVFSVELALARIWDALGQHSQALLHARNTVRLNSDSVEALQELGEIYLNRKEPGTASVVFGQALQLAPQNAELLEANGAAYLQMGDWERARKYLGKALLASPFSRPARIGLASALVRLGDSEQALSELGKIFTPAEAYGKLGSFLMEQKSWEEARQAFLHALALEPAHPYAQLQLLVAESNIPPPASVTIPPFRSLATVESKAAASFSGWGEDGLKGSAQPQLPAGVAAPEGSGLKVSESKERAFRFFTLQLEELKGSILEIQR